MSWFTIILLSISVFQFCVIFVLYGEYKIYKREAERYQEWYYDSDTRMIDLHEKYTTLACSTIIRTNRQLRNARAKIAQLMKDKASK